MEVIQVVKRFGLCGGMEEYVFRLTEELYNRGVKIIILCETQVSNINKNIEVIELGKSVQKPRWLSHLIFSHKVTKWIKQNTNDKQIIHSHERISCHHVTTLHSNLFNHPKRGLPSIRKLINEHLEKREVSSANLKKIVPVSSIIADEIKLKFPFAKRFLSVPIPPGVAPIKIKKKLLDTKIPTVGFMGTEWKRKGLPKVIEIWRELRKSIPGIRLCLAGFSKTETIPLNKEEMVNVEILGYIKQKEVFFQKIDLLLHPAKKEAYGMVIAEAVSLAIPVVCSQECGASVHNPHAGNSLKYSDSLSSWTAAVKRALSLVSNLSAKSGIMIWSETASHYKNLYQSL